MSENIFKLVNKLSEQHTELYQLCVDLIAIINANDSYRAKLFEQRLEKIVR